MTLVRGRATLLGMSFNQPSGVQSPQRDERAAKAAPKGGWAIYRFWRGEGYSRGWALELAIASLVAGAIFAAWRA